MKVTKELEKRNYSELKVGTCFEAGTMGDVFIKTNLIIKELGQREIAIRLEDGQDFYFEKDILVTVLNDAELIIRR